MTDYTGFRGKLPYASEIFGVYQPLIGWKSRRKLIRIGNDIDGISIPTDAYVPDVDVRFDGDTVSLGHVSPAQHAGERPKSQNDSLFFASVGDSLKRLRRAPQNAEEWKRVFTNVGGAGEAPSLEDSFKIRLERDVFPKWRDATATRIKVAARAVQRLPNEDPAQYQQRQDVAREIAKAGALADLERESVIAQLLNDLFTVGDVATLNRLFYPPSSLVPTDEAVRAFLAKAREAYDDPFVLFRPNKDLADVSLSPIGIVHLFRQYFFELDTFLGTPTGHIWLSPGSSVELVEVSTRKVTVERTTSTLYETTSAVERTATDQDEISAAVKQDNRDDVKLGITSTVHQSWGSGNATATASLSLDRTQQTAREETHKRMRQQTEKLSTQIRQNFQSTFKTVTETTDVSSKRYVLQNSTAELINYELRRKMRQVGVQVQDIGTFLCWETFVDEPGRALGLAELVHIAKPADLQPQPDQNEIPVPPRIVKSFQVNAVWNFGDRRQRNHLDLGYIPLDTVSLPVQPETGYQLENPGGRVALSISSLAGEGSEGQRYAFVGQLVGTNQIQVGVLAGASGISWDKRVDYVLVGELAFVPTPEKIAEIEAANNKIVADKEAASRAQKRAAEEAFQRAAKERIEQAADIRSRPFEELREEERTVVYRQLIRTLMSDHFYNMPASAEADELRHVLSELINAIFDVDKMLYFVAPEWWKPRTHYSQYAGSAQPFGASSITDWADHETRTDNYYITHDSQPARLGSSLGWLLQLDGDNHRNAFLNAPWVKAVIPVRPGRERAAVNWLQQMNVEGIDGLDKPYAASAAELDEIRHGLLTADPHDPVGDVPTLSDAIRFLCLDVARKHEEAVQVRKFPNDVSIHDDDKVSSTPVEKVYEHGFYPLQGGFRVDPRKPDPGNPDPHFQIFDQWMEVLPTDQVVPVEVRYDPVTGRLIAEPPD
ncbi:hypothetical protein [Microbispora bryophytorum]|uniref:hypothetical protein n=1 Tax=Microbispora bryophytorum TaxID=1460882 RepID=UPI00340FB7F1